MLLDFSTVYQLIVVTIETADQDLWPQYHYHYQIRNFIVLQEKFNTRVKFYKKNSCDKLKTCYSDL